MSRINEPSWKVPKIWDKATCYIIGGGPSISSFDLNLLKGRKVIATNNVYQLIPWVDYLFFMDKGWIKKHHLSIAKLPCIKFTVMREAGKYQRIMNLKFIERDGRFGFSRRPNRLTHGGNSGYCALQLAYLFGATRIVLVGFDMKVVNKQHNYHSGHKRKMDVSIYKDGYVKGFESLKDCKKFGIEILNATPGSALTCFPFVDFEEFVREEKENASR